MTNETFDDLIAFHGHSCPGLAMGYRMTQAALDRLAGSRSADEEIVAIVENDACGVDALQVLSGCTFGKGNLIFKDYGKHAYTLYNRQTGQGVRVGFNNANMPVEIRGDRPAMMEWILSQPQEQVVSLTDVHIDAPPPARIFDSVTCDVCGESVMKTRTRQTGEKVMCIPCAHK